MESVMLFLAPYLKTILVAVVVGFFCSLVYLLPTFKEILKNLAEKFLSDKISGRVWDATNKLYTVVEHCATAALARARVEVVQALADGKIDDEEQKKLIKGVSDEVMKILAPEMETFKKYLTGQFFFDYLVQVVTSYITRIATEKLKNGNFLTPVSSQLGTKS